jgi:hypothetical protein
MTRFDQVAQLKVQLKGIRPPIWRRIQVPDSCSFWDLHCALQDAMSWADSHLHAFEVVDPRTHAHDRIGIPDPEGWGLPVKAGWSQKVRRYLNTEGAKALYLYDFGDGWEHVVTLEKVLPRDKQETYPRCMAGRRACPPEDCGGVWGYSEIVSGTSEYPEEYADYDPEHFDPADVFFEDPKERLRWFREMRY